MDERCQDSERRAREQGGAGEEKRTFEMDLGSFESPYFSTRSRSNQKSRSEVIREYVNESVLSQRAWSISRSSRYEQRVTRKNTHARESLLDCVKT